MGKFLLGRPYVAGIISIFLIAGTAAAQLSMPNSNLDNANISGEVPLPTEILTRRIVVEPVPETPSNGFFRKTANQTPSGFEVPRYVSLKFGKVNGRTGPSRDHSIAWQYQRRGLPLIVVAETEMWRKVRDINGDEAWVRKPALSGERFVMTTMESTLFSKPKTGTSAVALSEPGALLRLEDCNEDGWCRVKASNGLKGWMPIQHLWGAREL